jgi:hypothetical protein
VTSPAGKPLQPEPSFLKVNNRGLVALVRALLTTIRQMDL